MTLVKDDFPVLELQPQAQVRQFQVAHADGRYHAGHILRLPEHLVQHDLVPVALERRDINLANRRPPLRREALDHCAGRHDLHGLGLAGHAIGRMHRGAEHVPVLQYHRAEVATDAQCDRLTLDLELGMA